MAKSIHLSSLYASHWLELYIKASPYASFWLELYI